MNWSFVGAKKTASQCCQPYVSVSLEVEQSFWPLIYVLPWWIWEENDKNLRWGNVKVKKIKRKREEKKKKVK